LIDVLFLLTISFTLEGLGLMPVELTYKVTFSLAYMVLLFTSVLLVCAFEICVEFYERKGAVLFFVSTIL